MMSSHRHKKHLLNLRYVTLFLLFIFVWAGCGSEEKDLEQHTEIQSGERYAFSQWQPNVTYEGALRNIMRENNLSAHLHFEDFPLRSTIYALGAFEDLKGEILVLRGESYSTRAVADEVRFIDLENESAAFMVWAEVEKWQGFEVPDSVLSFTELENFTALQANNFGIDQTKPFPFGLTGTVAELSWHVIDWPEDDTVHTHEKHMVTGPHGVLTGIPAEILGFYSDSHHGIFTHHSSNMHLHFVSQPPLYSGHVDDLTLSPGSTLWLPAE